MTDPRCRFCGGDVLPGSVILGPEDWQTLKYLISALEMRRGETGDGPLELDDAADVVRRVEAATDDSAKPAPDPLVKRCTACQRELPGLAAAKTLCPDCAPAYVEALTEQMKGEFGHCSRCLKKLEGVGGPYWTCPECALLEALGKDLREGDL